MSNFDEDMLQDFLDEASELLESIEEDFLKLEEQGPDADADLIHKCFRAIHTIKGTSGFIGLKNIGTVSHAMETLLSYFRDQKTYPNKEYINVLLQGADRLKSLLDDIQNSDEHDISEVAQRLQGINQRIEQGESADQEPTPDQEPTAERKVSAQEAHSPTPSTDGETVKDFISEANKYLANFEKFCETWLDSGDIRQNDYILTIYNSINAIKGTSSFIGLDKIRALAEGIEKALLHIYRNPDEFADEGAISDAANTLLQAKDKLQVLTDDSQNSEQEDISAVLSELNHFMPTEAGTKSALEQAAPEGQKAPKAEQSVRQESQASQQNGSPPSGDTPSGGSGEKASANKSSGDSESVGRRETLRVSVPLIDNLMRLAGELVLIRNQQLLQFQEIKMGNREMIQRLDGVTSDIQEAIMQTRLQPLSNVFNKFPRLVRDLSNSLDKEIDFYIHGGEVELDKTILEEISGPLTHLIRNSVDHGLETPEERRNAGKSPTGQLSLSAEHEGGIIVIRIQDDGRGLDVDKIKNKALTKGLVPPDTLAQMTEQEITNLIFVPGFSTSESVSDVSGRGVGMDVVKNGIEKLSGSVELESTAGQGTLITVKLPLTLAIIPALVIRSGDYRYAIPQVNLEILLSIPKDEIDDKIERAGSQEVYRLQDKLIPLVRLNELLARKKRFSLSDKYEIINKYHGENKENQQAFTIAVLGVGNRRFGLIVDSVTGAEEIVVKPLHPAIKDLRIYSGATIMGDGAVALILDAEGLADFATLEFNADLESGFLDYGEEKQKEAVLIFRSGEQEQFALSLQLVRRIVEVDLAKIEKIGSKEFLTVEERSVRILRLEEVLDVSPIVQRETSYLILFKHLDQPIGLLVSSLVDISEVSVNLHGHGYTQKGLLGSDIIYDKMTLFLDIYYILARAEPEWFQEREVELSQIARQGENRALVVDDSSIFRQMISKYLSEFGFEISTADNGQNALEQAEKQSFDIIISDIEMPVMDGLDFARALRKKSAYQSVPALALSSLNDEEIAKMALDAGFDDYEVKLEKEHFFNKVSSLISQQPKKG